VESNTCRARVPLTKRELRALEKLYGSAEAGVATAIAMAAAEFASAVGELLAGECVQLTYAAEALAGKLGISKATALIYLRRMPMAKIGDATFICPPGAQAYVIAGRRVAEEDVARALCKAIDGCISRFCTASVAEAAEALGLSKTPRALTALGQIIEEMGFETWRKKDSVYIRVPTALCYSRTANLAPNASTEYPPSEGSARASAKAPPEAAYALA
jgi:hypothetical protein